ncbi:hypothetical protein AAFF_G00146230 [Aldrovandia affinis]|uniref:Uncharacterized protein n=1 Tax=Aldrovandia affinis TaxID=143900 RepID=A0AAD7RQ79_9TELE|nr:hypothetical protein AAFF_G00146230 [Aldrovandia affinis]
MVSLFQLGLWMAMRWAVWQISESPQVSDGRDAAFIDPSTTGFLSGALRSWSQEPRLAAPLVAEPEAELRQAPRDRLQSRDITARILLGRCAVFGTTACTPVTMYGSLKLGPIVADG